MGFGRREHIWKRPWTVNSQGWAPPDLTIPYGINMNAFSREQIQIIDEALQHWRDVTKLKFEWRDSGVRPCIQFEPANESCSSPVGCINGDKKHIVGCNVGNGFGRTSVIHEIGHIVGLYHEHQRPDRDNWVEIPTNRLGDHNYKKLSGAQHHNRIWSGTYDCLSLMHYDSNYIRGTQGGCNHFGLGSNTDLGFFDIEVVAQMYGF